MKTNKFLLVYLSVILCMILSLTSCKYGKDDDIISYSTDVDTFTEIFSYFDSYVVEKVNCKYELLTSRALGPTPMKVEAFVVLREDDFFSIIENHSLVESKIVFSQELDYLVTEFKDYSWESNEDLSRTILSPEFIGEVYFDTINKVIYLTAES